MIIEVKKDAQNAVIEISGRLDTTTAPSLEKVINDDIDGIKNLTLDFNGLEYISSAGLRVILFAQKKMQSIGALKLINVCETVMDVFEITGFADILTIE